MKIRLGEFRSLLYEVAHDSVAAWLKTGDVVSTDEYEGNVTIDVPFGGTLIRVTIEADQITDIESA